MPATAFASFGFAPGPAGFSAVATGEGGFVDQQAGSHPQALGIEVSFKPESPGSPFTDGDVKDLEIELPGGLVENPGAVPQCSLAQFHTPRSSPFETSLSGESCPDKTQVGTVEVRSSYGGGETRTFGLFNLDPPPGAPSEIGFNPYGAPVIFVPHLRQADGEYGVTLAARNIPQLVGFSGFGLKLWGTPWSIVHNAQRGNCLNEAEPSFGWAKCSVGPPKLNPATAYLSLPSACEGPLGFGAVARSWQAPPTVSRAFAGQSLEGCAGLEFKPAPAIVPSNPRASSPSGIDFRLEVDQDGLLAPARLAPSPVRGATVALPEGVTVNPSVGAGLGTCEPGGYAAETVGSAPGAGCPNASKIGDFTVRSPLFAQPLEGALFLATPFQNPFGTLLAVYLVAKDPERGVLVKVAGRIDADPASGQLTARFDRLPQLPYTELRIHFREGQRSPLATPAACGTYTSGIDLTPWRDPSAVRHTDSHFQISAGIDGGPCPTGSAPFAPASVAGTLNSQAGAHTPFYLHLTRRDTEQEITSYSAALPPGLVATVAGIPFCPEAAIAAAKQTSGFAETADPSCPAASEIGHTVAGYGLGGVLSFAPGKLYLAGPFGGQPLSIVAIDAATVGPFDLGTIVIRSAIALDPQSAGVSIDSAASDPIPHIIDGIPTHLRDIRVYVDRPGFTLNPTSCARFSTTSTLKGSGLRFSDPTDDILAAAPSPFQAFNCGALGFQPKIGLSFKGGTRQGEYPALRAEVRPRPGDANFASTSVTLPATEFLAQSHIDKVCTPVQFARGACPAGSVYGHARVLTPLLSAPLEGPVYLRSSKHDLPDMVAALSGGGLGISLEVVGRIDSSHGGIRGRFEGLPDAPFTSFTMTLNGGRHGLLANSEDLCAKQQYASARLIGQNNRGLATRVPLRVRCGKRGKNGHKHRHRAGRGASR
ncbi:MAG TPA: hypothetical protein VFJ64_10335 [Solirubrobacterales bacterium]|nr:hypothetical protein [Solirubrobacterales bacterium]